jgi:hypothetical protein
MCLRRVSTESLVQHRLRGAVAKQQRRWWSTEYGANVYIFTIGIHCVLYDLFEYNACRIFVRLTSIILESHSKYLVNLRRIRLVYKAKSASVVRKTPISPC